MAKIKKLNKHLMNMIAAGEVVEKPAGIVKELVDNAIDAKANIIEIIVQAGGIDLIKVIDNGEGMSKQDAVLAFERHATSKIEKEEDLWAINTLGFRGEALPSIASVAKVNLITNDGIDASELEVNYGKMLEVKQVASNQGTMVTITGLFHRTPARLKNFNSINYEMAIITSNIEKFALAYPNISFILKNDKNIVFQTSGNNDLQEVVYQIYGREIAENSIIFSDKDNDFQLSGSLTLPDYTRSNRNHVLLFVNNRMIRSYTLVNQVLKAYEKYLFSNRYPIAIIKIKMDNKLVDVNVHPTKWQVKIFKEKQLNKLIVESIEKVLGKNMQAQKLRQISQERKTFQSELDLNQDKQIKVKNNFMTLDEVEKFDKSTSKYEFLDKELETSKNKNLQENFPRLRLIGQMHGKYVLAESPEGLYIIDQHAAEERVNFENIKNKLNKGIIETTPLLFPERIEIEPSLIPLIETIIKNLNKVGFIIEIFASNSIVVREIPLWLLDKDVESFIREYIEYYKEDETTEIDLLRKDAIASIACHLSIRFNKVLSKVEMEQVIDNLSKTKQPYHCPHGRPTLIKITEKQLSKEFLR